MPGPTRRYSDTQLDHDLANSLAKAVATLATGASQEHLDVPVTRMVEVLEWRTKQVTAKKRTLFGGTRLVTSEVPYQVPVSRAEVTSEPMAAWLVSSQSAGGIRRRGSARENWDIKVNLYLLEDGRFASVTLSDSLFTYENGKYDFYKEAPEVEVPVSAGRAAALADRNADFSLRTGVTVAGDGLRESLIHRAPDGERARLRRAYPSLAREAAATSYVGILVRFFPAKGFGFIQHPQLGEVFLHMSRVPAPERRLLVPGASISFSVRQSSNGPAVASGRVIG